MNCLADAYAYQQNIGKLMSWPCYWQLCFITSKCKVMHIGRKNIERTYNLASAKGIHDQAEVYDECDIRINFQFNLQFDKHVTTICAKS